MGVFLFKMCKSIHISGCKILIYFTRKNLLFLFYTLIFIKHTHQSIYFTYLFNKIFIILQFFIISSLPLSLADPTLPKNTKILNALVTVTVHICTVTVALVHLYTILHPPIWVFFLSKYVKWSVFCILQDFATTNVIALIWV